MRSPIFLLISIIFLFASCVEEIEMETNAFEEVLVIEGTITNEVKQHQINLSSSYKIDSQGPLPVTGARVTVTGDREYVFEEAEAGVYLSNEAFAASTGIDYQLLVHTEGAEYVSELVQLTPHRSIEALQAERRNYKGEDGVVITLTSETAEGEGAGYYRYEYDETFKFHAAYNKTRDLIIEDGEIIEVEKTREEYTCYRTENSRDILLANSNALSQDRIDDFLVTFIDSKDPKLAQRYSILVKQYVISMEAYNYYEKLKELSGTDNVFSQTQPGYLGGNVNSVNDPTEKVIGYFSVASVSSKRLFFNYEDFYDPDGIRPKMMDYCPVTNPLVGDLRVQIENGTSKWYETPFGMAVNPERPFFVVPANCVDCTRMGSNEIPPFWEE